MQEALGILHGVLFLVVVWGGEYGSGQTEGYYKTLIGSRTIPCQLNATIGELL